MRRPILCTDCGKPNPEGGGCPWCNYQQGRLAKRIQSLRSRAKGSSRATSTGIFRCINGHTWRVEVDPNLAVQTDAFACPDCGKESMREGILKARVTGAMCRASCWLAEDPFHCSCSCGGANHARGGPPLDQHERLGRSA